MGLCLEFAWWGNASEMVTKIYGEGKRRWGDEFDKELESRGIKL